LAPATTSSHLYPAAEDRAKFKRRNGDRSSAGAQSPPLRSKFPYPDSRLPPEQFRKKTPPRTRPKPRPAYQGHKATADASVNPEKLVNIYPNEKLLRTILDAYRHPNVNRRKTYQQLVESRGGRLEQVWKGVALVRSQIVP